MKKINLQDWADFVRGVAQPERRKEMEDLLAGGSPEAARSFELMKSVADAAPYWGGAEPPAEVMARAAGIFRAREKESLWELPLVPLRLVFDSLAAPQLAGVRAGEAGFRDTVHEGPDLTVSLRVEEEPGSELTAVVGQLQAEPGSGVTVSSRPVFIYQRERVVARTLSGGQGEFQLEFSGRRPLRLVVALEDPGRRIELELSAGSKARGAGRRAKKQDEGSGV